MCLYEKVGERERQRESERGKIIDRENSERKRKNVCACVRK